jgi:DNA-binding winged helix-turn-helix (wHTH) protein
MTNSTFPAFDGANRSAADASLEFGRFRVLLRQRQLLADGVPIELGTRAFELLLALLEANGSLISKERLITRVWPGIAVAEDNVKVHVCTLRKALGEDRNFIRTEFGRGYRFIATVQRLPGVDVTAQCDGSTDQLGSCFLDGPVGDRRLVGRLTIALADTLIPLEVRLRSAETRAPERASMPIRRMEFDDERHCLLQEWRP